MDASPDRPANEEPSGALPSDAPGLGPALSFPDLHSSKNRHVTCLRIPWAVTVNCKLFTFIGLRR